MTRFVEDPNFDKNLRGFRGSLNPVGHRVRAAADRIRDSAKRLAEADAAEAVGYRDALADERDGPHADAFARAKTRAWQLRAHARRIRAVMLGEAEGHPEVVGRVVANYPGSLSIEFGGTDYTVPIGDSDKHVTHPAYGHLRRALDQGA